MLLKCLSMLQIWEFESEVLGIDDFVENGKIIARIIRLEKPEYFSFKAGQFAMITIHGYEPGENRNKQLWRAYSICSSPLQDDIELCISIKEPPSFTHFMNENVRVEGKMNVKGPYGGFVLRENPEAINLIAAGTGIAPIMGMIRDLALSQAKIPLRLFYGYRNGNQHYYSEELKELAANMENLGMLTIASREGPNPGYVQKLLEGFDFTGGKELEDTYICGPPKMVDHAKEIMMQKGFPKTRIHVEKYD